MKHVVRYPLRAAIVLAVVAVCQGCASRETPEAATVPAANPEVEAARLIRTLDMAAHLQERARDYVAKEMVRGIAPKPALRQWILDQRDRGAVIRCKPEVSATDECIART